MSIAAAEVALPPGRRLHLGECSKRLVKWAQWPTPAKIVIAHGSRLAVQANLASDGLLA
jgi:hypothetical protein